MSRDGTAPTDGAGALLQRYRDEGERCLSDLAGRFAVAIVDARSEKVLLAVDPMGIEKLAYALRDDGLVFSSSAASVARFPAVAAPLSNQALFSYLMLHMVPAPETVYEGVTKLRAGTFAVLERGRLRIDRYWRPRFAASGAGSAAFDVLRQRLHESLRAAVRHSSPDETTGAFLSGGLDSSTVAGVLAEVGGRPARTFSIGFGYPDYDELPYARIANKRFDCEPHEYVVRGEDIVSTLPLIARNYDEPFGNSSALPVYHCARLARAHGVTHLLAGDGGDELFAGNSRYAEQQVFERYGLVPRLVKRGLLEPLLGVWPDALTGRFVRRAKGYVRKANVPLPERLEAWNVVYQSGAAEFLEPDFVRTIDPRLPITRMYDLWNEAPTGDTLQHMLYHDWQYTLADNDLRKVETMCGVAGVRVSYPMLDPRVVDLSLEVPSALMMPGMQLRSFYKRAMHDFLPDEIINKKKHGFGLPFGLWLQDSAELHDKVNGNLSSLRSRGMVRSAFIDKLLSLHESDDARHYGVFVWVLAMLEEWFREHSTQPKL